jgi:hypothetical protein
MHMAQGGKFENRFLSGGVYAEREALQVIIKRFTLAVENNPVEAYLRWVIRTWTGKMVVNLIKECWNEKN